MAGLRDRTAALLALALVLGLVLCISAGAAGGSGVVSVNGVIGPLQVNKSNRAAVVAFAGQPDQEIKERVLGFGAYDALGYDCQDTETDFNVTLGNSGPYCKTAYFIDSSSHALEDFFTTSDGFRESHGVRIGTTASAAQKLTHQSVSHRCLAVIRLQTGKASLRIGFKNGKATTFVVHSLRRTSGIFNCLA